jgi:hypothetical protein
VLNPPKSIPLTLIAADRIIVLAEDRSNDALPASCPDANLTACPCV